MSKSREQLNDKLRKIDITGKYVLDVGSQDHLTARLTQGDPKEYYTLDIDPQWRPSLVHDLNEPIPFNIAGKFDVIFCIEVLEHCWDPVQVIKNLSYCARPGGDIYISAPFINPHHDYWDYLRFTGEWYQQVLDKFGIGIVQIEERIATLGKEHLEQFYKAEGMKVSKVRPEYGRYTYPIGYFVHGRKKQ